MNILSNLVFVLLFLVVPLFAVSAPPFPFQVQQADGSKIPIRMFGHEYYNWMETEDGYVIDWVEDDTRLGWYYSDLDSDGKFYPTHLLVKYPAPDYIDIPKNLREISPKVREIRHSTQKFSPNNSKYLDRSVSFSTIKPLVFLVDFNDLPSGMPERVYSKEQFQHLLFDTNMDSDDANLHPRYDMSVRDYYDEISNGQLEIYGDSESIVDWTTVDYAYSYYVDGKQGTGQAPGDVDYTKSAAALVVEIALAIENSLDFSKFDGNNDGDVDVVILIVEGWANGDDDQFWPHMFILPSTIISNDHDPDDDGFLEFDGVAIKKYIVIPEQTFNQYGDYYKQGYMHPIGTICHELGHVLGLPDLYDTSENSAAGIGDWGLMGSGNYQIETSPAYMSAWSRYRLGFIEPDTLSDVYDLEITIPPAEELDIGAAYILPMSSNLPQEYLIIENRQKIGSDEYLKQSGLLVWHIDETITDMYPVFSASVNIDPHFYGVNLLQADGNDDLYTTNGAADNGDPFPGSADKREITSITIPNSDLYDYDRDADGDSDKGGKSNIRLTNINENSDNSITLTAHNPNQQGILLAYDEAGYEGWGFHSSALSWAGIQMVAPENALLSGISTIFPSSEGSVRGYSINIWKGWTGNMPERLLSSLNGDVNWDPNPNNMRNGGWANISVSDANIILNEGETYYVEINYHGVGPIYPFDYGQFANSEISGMSYGRSNTQENCQSFPHGDWNIRVSLNPDFCNADCLGNGSCTAEIDCAGDCGGNAIIDECGICEGPGAIYECGCIDIDGDTCDCNGNILDCNGICGGENEDCLAIMTNLIPEDFNLYQNYPNPFNPTTQIRYDLPEYSKVSLRIYDIIGREIAVLYNGYQTPGQHKMTWDASNFVSGLYILEINVTSSNQSIIFRDIKKILYIQ